MNEDLLTPIEPRRTGETDAEAEMRVRSERERKLGLLANNFGIADDDPMAINRFVLALVIKHYPGFRVEKPGRKRDPKKSVDDLILLYGVDKARENGETIDAAIQSLIEKNGWDDGLSTLRRRYFALKKTGPERQAAAEMAETLLPDIIQHFASKR